MNRTNKNTLINAIIKSYAMAFKFAAKNMIPLLGITIVPILFILTGRAIAPLLIALNLTPALTGVITTVVCLLIWMPLVYVGVYYFFVGNFNNFPSTKED